MTKHKGVQVKAYSLSIKDNDDAGAAIVFAETANDAKKQVYAHDTLVDALEGGWITLRAHRAKRYDGMENLDEAHLALKQWRDGWSWFDVDYPDPDTATDAEFIKWYKSYFGGTS
jgi:hypothetical protein